MSDRDELARIRYREGAFWAKVIRLGPEECWEWQGATNAGRVVHGSFEGTTAHRFAWATAHGHYPNRGVVVRHRCDNGTCVNPNHLEIGSQADNHLDMVLRGRGWWQKGFCKNGHRRGSANTYISALTGKKECLDCKQHRQQFQKPRVRARVQCDICGVTTTGPNAARHRHRHERARAAEIREAK